MKIEMKETLCQILNRIDEQVEQPMVTAKFGDNWQEHQKKMYAQDDVDTSDLIRIAWIQGRRAILLERELEKLLIK